MMSISMRVWDGIGPVLDARIAGTAAVVATVMERGANEMEDYARQNAPWSDRTGAARAGLSAEVNYDLTEIDIILSHGVDYGFWLEVIQDGEYAILMPTIEALGPKILHEAGLAVIEGA
jgi:hypothetical protein